MNVEIINVGTELLLGEIVNTNAAYLQKMCRDLGFNVYYQSVVGDNPPRLYKCLDIAFQRGADCVITTGGLGPTTDDLTKELSAKYLHLDMVLIEEEARKVKDKCTYITGQKTIPDNNYKQAYFPKDAYILENRMGTANGCVMCHDGKMIINLPGPPKEMKEVVEYALLPYLEQYKQETIYTCELMTMFIGESKLAEVLSDIIAKQHDISIALYAGEETVRVRLAVKATSQKQADTLMAPWLKEIQHRIEEYIIPHQSLKEAVLATKIPISIEYKSDFRFHDDFLEPLFSKNPKIRIVVDKKETAYGDIIEMSFNDETFSVPNFLKAEYSYGKIEARFIGRLYQYMKKGEWKNQDS